MKTKHMEKQDRVNKMLAVCYQYIRKNANTNEGSYGKQIVTDMEDLLGIEHTPVTDLSKHRILKGVRKRDVDIVTDAIYTPMSFKAIGLKYDLSAARARQIYFKILLNFTNIAKQGRYAYVEMVDADTTHKRKFHRNVVAYVIDYAFDPNTSHPMDIKDAIALADRLNDEERYLTLEEQEEPNRVRKLPPPHDVVEISSKKPFDVGFNDTQKWWLNKSVNHLDLSAHPKHALDLNGIREIRDLVQTTELQVLKIPGMGIKSLREINDALAACGLKLGMQIVNNGWGDLESIYTKMIVEVIANGPVTRTQSKEFPKPIAVEKESVLSDDAVTVIEGLIRLKGFATQYERFKIKIPNATLYRGIPDKPSHPGMVYFVNGTENLCQRIVDYIYARYREINDGNGNKIAVMQIVTGPFKNNFYSRTQFKEDPVIKDYIAQRYVPR